MKSISAGFVMLALAGTANAAPALTPSEERGKTYAETNCGMCHSLEKTGDSPLSEAPPFRALHTRYPVEALEESLAEGIRTGHAGMPEFHLEPDQIADFIAFLKTLE